MRSDTSRLLAPLSRARAFPVLPTSPARPLTARELQLASDVELARGNRQRAETLSWRAHDARTGLSA